ncbi:MAG: T9SS type A sorting domain-containing protein [Ignavibacteria bacterium]|nr:T9SS type A sorting domain-containing protein [Ignavibacteria bacterium]
MNKQTFYNGFFRLLIVALTFGFILIINDINAQPPATGNIPSIPRLSLNGGSDDWDANWYPDGRIWIPPSVDPNKPREFLVPVFIENGWYTREETKDIYIADPIKSFSFKVLYDSSAIRAVGVQTFGSRELDYFNDERYKYHTLAKDFSISWMDERDTTYRKFLNPLTPYADYSKGRAIKITGVSTKPLPPSNDFKVFLYIRFVLVPRAGEPIGLAGNTPLIIGTDTIMYNDLNVRKEAPFAKYRPTWKGRDVYRDFPDPDKFAGLAGVNNEPFPPVWNTEPHYPGVVFLRISDQVPQFGFILERAIGLVPQIAPISDDGSLYELRDPITIDSAAPTPLPWGKRSFRLWNQVPTSRLLDIEVETSEPWLFVRTWVPPGARAKTPFPMRTRKGFIPFIDNGILGEIIGTPIWGRRIDSDPEVHIEIQCDPTAIQNPGPEPTGIYVGYITFKSHSALISPVRVKVTFIYFRNPIEWFESSKAAGINLTIVPRVGFGNPVKLIFGTGHRATIGVDTLFGEYAFDYPMPDNEFGARFFPPPNAPQNVKLEVANGFGNFSPDDDNADGTPKWCISRDIRNMHDTMQSHIFLVRFKAEDPSYYPIVIYWDIRDFPDGANLFLRDTANGQLFPAVNMRRATIVGGTMFSYTIDDPRVRSFLIEYTPARVIDYVDEFGQPIIKKGWNFLSLPVRPINNEWDVVYPNAINKPFFWSQNQYQFDELLRVGVGYFVKYSDRVDRKFAGSFIPEISVFSGDSVKIYPGWNTIGCVSTPLSIRNIAFSSFGLESPNPVEVRRNGVWSYKTNRGYEEVSELRPGLGYWIKSDAHGYLLLLARSEKAITNDAPSIRDLMKEQSVKMEISDNAQNSKTLYLAFNTEAEPSMFELPPLPISEIFDIRFTNNSLMETSLAPTFVLSGVTFPISISISDPSNEYTFVDAVTGSVLGTISPSSNTLIIPSASNTIRVLVSNLASESELLVTPNPVVSSSVLRYTLKQDSDVQITLVDVFGKEVKTLVNGFTRAGDYSLTINADEFASGQYLCKMKVGNTSKFVVLNIIK